MAFMNQREINELTIVSRKAMARLLNIGFCPPVEEPRISGRIPFLRYHGVLAAL